MAGSEKISKAKRDLMLHLNGFDLNEVIGRGTFAEVYRATNVVRVSTFFPIAQRGLNYILQQTKEVLAVKYFRQELKNSRRFQLAAKEIAFMKILEHPNIVQLKVFEVNRRFVFIGTEYAAFGSLIRLLVDRKPLPESFIQGVMRQVLCALDFMHSLGILHGDVKPHNILCTALNLNKPTVKICDFGLSEIILKGESFTFNSGSLLFMAPEVHLKQLVDLTCDLWSAGVVMFNMMFGRSLFGLEDKDLHKHVGLLRRKTPFISFGSENYSQTCNDLVKRLLAYDKRHRIQGEALRSHPFLKLETPKPNGKEFLDKARGHIAYAEKFSNNKLFGEGLVEGIQALIELKIHHNSLQEQDQRDKLQQMLAHFEMFVMKMESHLVQTPEITRKNMEEGLSDEDFKKHLASTPKLLSGFEIGCSAEMYKMEKNYPKALELFHQALQTILPLMKTEPKSYRKEMLGRKLSKWIEELENLNKLLLPESAQEVVVPSSSTAAD